MRKWSGTVIQATLDVTWDMWVYRNTTLHDDDHPWKLEGRGRLNESLQEEYRRHTTEIFLPKDNHLFKGTVDHLIEHYDDEMKAQWLESVRLARARWSTLQRCRRSVAQGNLNHWLTRDQQGSEREGMQEGMMQGNN